MRSIDSDGFEARTVDDPDKFRYAYSTDTAGGVLEVLDQKQRIEGTGSPFAIIAEPHEYRERARGSGDSPTVHWKAGQSHFWSNVRRRGVLAMGVARFAKRHGAQLVAVVLKVFLFANGYGRKTFL